MFVTGFGKKLRVKTLTISLLPHMFVTGIDNKK